MPTERVDTVQCSSVLTSDQGILVIEDESHVFQPNPFSSPELLPAARDKLHAELASLIFENF